MPEPERPHISAQAGERSPATALPKRPPAQRAVVRAAGVFAGALAKHPLLVLTALGASGARLATTAVNRLHTTGGRYALATMCIGVGQGIAVVLERV